MATYKRPAGIKYTDMAIFFDSHIRDAEGERPDALMYQYLYHIVYMLACKGKYFSTKNFDDFAEYDEFSLYAASRMYLRVIANKDIKSILNYAKFVVPKMRVDYLREKYSGVLVPEYDGEDVCQAIGNRLKDSVQADYNHGLSDEMERQFSRIPHYIRKTLRNTPYRDDKVLCRRLYMSVLITILKSVTLSNGFLAKLNEDGSQIRDEAILRAFEREKETSTTVWMLDNSWANYVELLANMTRQKIGDNINGTAESFRLSDDDLNSILMSAYNTEPRDNSEVE